jgi:hypothetical protein
MDEIYSLINAEYSQPEKARIMNSMRQHCKGLTLFVDNPEIPMDNNLAEGCSVTWSLVGRTTGGITPFGEGN